MLLKYQHNLNNHQLIYVVNYDYKFKIFEEVFKRKISSEDNIINFVKEICNDINNLLGRGVTILSATGGYTGKEKAMLFCTVRRHQVSAVYEISDKYDKNAFIVISDAGEIIGEGFKALR